MKSTTTLCQHGQQEEKRRKGKGVGQHHWKIAHRFARLYLPTPEQHKRGGYETWLDTHLVEEQAPVKIVDAVLELSAEFAEKDRPGM